MSRWLAAVAVALSTLACAARAPATPPTEVEARAFLRDAIALATAGDFAGLCTVGGGNCERILEGSGRDAPDEAPRIVGTRTLVSTPTRIGGLVLELCGTDDRGRLYYTEMLVFRDRGRLLAIEPVYWSGFGIADDPFVGGEPTNPVVRCSAKPSARPSR